MAKDKAHSQSDSELAAMLDEEFDDWGDQPDEETEGKQQELEVDYHVEGSEPEEEEQGLDGEEEDVQDGLDNDADDNGALGEDAAPTAGSDGWGSDDWGSDADIDAMAEDLLQDVAYSRHESAAAMLETAVQPEAVQAEAAAAAAAAVLAEEKAVGLLDTAAAGEEPAAKRRRLPTGRGSRGGTAAITLAGLESASLPTTEASTNRAAAAAAAVVAAPSTSGRSSLGLGAAAATSAPSAQTASKLQQQQECSHPTFWADMCVVCGAAKPAGDDPPPAVQGAAAGAAGRKLPSRGRQRDVPHEAAGPPEQQVTRIKHMHARAHLELTGGEAERLKQQEVARLLAEKRLVLVLDLDHTLLNSVRLGDVASEHVGLLNQMLEQEAGHPKRLLYCLRDKNLWTKLRPFVHEFLAAARELYELHIYTMGDKHYAAEIRRILDPGGQIFAGVISQNDSTSSAAKHLDVALVHDRFVVILDDTEQVWPHHGRNLIKVERYHFFPASIRQWHPNAKSLLEQGRDESTAQGTLATCLRVLQQVHADFYREEGAEVPLVERDVRCYLGRRRESILQGCHIVFSHCWPQAYATPYNHPLWRMAESLGAECSTTYDPQRTTHVVAANAGTEKVQLARRQGKHAVGIDWLHACLFRWERVGEAALPPPQNSKSGGSGKPSSQLDDLSIALQAAGGGEPAAAAAAGGASAPVGRLQAGGGKVAAGEAEQAVKEVQRTAEQVTGEEEAPAGGSI